jgi:Rod binding domain-containing protein
VAEQLETAFLTEMLRHAGVGAQARGFGGGIGEEQFASFLRGAQAEAMMKAGGIGMTETLFQSMTRGEK